MDKERKGYRYFRRIDYILSLTKAGLSPTQIDERLQIRDLQLRHDPRIRGLTTEARVARILREAPYVDSLSRTSAYSPEDMAGYDFYAYLRGIDPLDVVGVQVKSSQRGIEEFLKERIRDPKLQGQGERGTRRWLISRRLVMINGSLTEREIIESFISQVELIAQRARLEQSQQAKRK